MERDEGLPEGDEWVIDTDDLEFGEKIGGGNFGSVYIGEYVGTPVAIKEILINEEEEEMCRKYIEREVSVLRSVRHPNVVNFVGVCRLKDPSGGNSKGHKERVYIVTEWLPKGNLGKFIRQNKGKLSWKKRVTMAVDIASAMAFLHKKNLIHRDLKPENLLITDNGGIKLCDFGFARRKPKKAVGLMTLAGTEDYMAPEVTLGEDYDEKCDVYSFGLVLYEMIVQEKMPFRGPATCFDFRPEDLKALKPSDCPEELWQIAQDCCKYRSGDRISFAEAMKRLKALAISLPDKEEPSPSLPTAAETTTTKSVGSTKAKTTVSWNSYTGTGKSTGSGGGAATSKSTIAAAASTNDHTAVLAKERARLMKTFGNLKIED